MTRKAGSKNLSKSSRKRKSSASRKDTAFGRHLIAGLKEVVAHVRGEKVLQGYEICVPAAIDVAGIRHAVGMTQRQFADSFGLDVTAVHAWEQKRRQPDRAARVLLTIIEREPDAVLRALKV